MIEKKQVLLIYPRSPSDRKKPDRPPLGLLTVAAPLVEMGFEVSLLDERAEADFDSILATELKKGPICAGISSMSGDHITGALRISRIIKQCSKIPVVWGGVHASLMPHSTLCHNDIDMIVRDDGEETFPQLLEAIRAGNRSFASIKGLGFKKDRKLFITESADPGSLDAIPLIPFHLIDFNKYRSLEPWTNEKKVLPMETSRGCPFSCSFCTESMRKKKWRSLSPERVLIDIKQYIQRYKIHSFTFIDDNLFGDVARGERIIELLIQENLGVQWYTNMRTDYIANASDQAVGRLENSGCRMLTFGAESGSNRLLNMVNKHASKDDVIKTNQILKNRNIHPHFVTIRGFPTETPEEAQQTLLLNIRLLLENRNAICDSPFLITTPGTSIAMQCLGEKLNSFNLEDWAKIFHVGESGKCPPWLSQATYDFLRKFRIIVAIIHQTNRKTTSPFLNLLFRSLLKLGRPYMGI